MKNLRTVSKRPDRTVPAFRRSTAFTIALAAILLPKPSGLADQTWKNTRTNFNAGSSWVSGVAPGAADEAVFSSAAVTQPQLSASLTIEGLTFSTSGASGYDLTSSSTAYALTLTNTGAGTSSDALNGTNTSGTNTIDAALVLGAASGTQTFSQAVGGTLKLNGTLTGASTLTLSLAGAGVFDFTADNSTTLASPVTVGTGTTLQIGSNSALGTGTLAATGTTTTIQSDSSANRVLTNALTIGSSTSTTLGTSITGNLTFGAATLSGGDRTVVVNNALTTVASLGQDGSARVLTKQGTGALVVTGNKTTTGAVDIQGGALAVGGTYTTTGNLKLDGGVLALNGTFSENLGTASGQTQFIAAKNGGFAAYGTNATFGSSANNLTVNIGGSGTPSTLTWGTTASFLASGQTLILGSVVSNGTVTLSNPLNLGGASASTSQTIQVDRGATATVGAADAILSGGITGTGSLIKTGTGTLSINPTNTSYTGTLTINGGILAATAANYFGTSGTAININAGTLRYDATYTGAGNTITLGSTTSTIDVSGTNGYTPGLISGTGTLNKTDTGILTLASANTYNGGTTLSGGTLVLGASSTVASGVVTNGPVGTGTLTLATGGTLRSDSTTARTINNNLSLSGSLTLGDATNTGSLLFDNTGLTTRSAVLTANTTLTNASTVEFASVLSGGASLGKMGAGTLFLDSANTYNGGTSITGGVLAVSTNSAVTGGVLTSGALGTGTLTLADGTRIRTGDANGRVIENNVSLSGNVSFGSTGTGFGPLTFNSTGLTTPSTIALTANTTATVLTDTVVTFNNPVSGSAFGLTKAGAATLVLGAVNTYTGTTLSLGTLQMSGSGTLGSTSGSLTVSGGTLDLNATNQSVGSLTGSGGTIINNNTGTSVTLTIGTGDATGGNYLGVIANNTSGTGTVALAKTGAGTNTLGGTNSYSGATTINNGVLRLANASGMALTATSGVTVNPGGTLLFGAANQIATTVPVSLAGGTIQKAASSSQGTATSAGVGALTLTAASVADFTRTSGVLTFSSLTDTNNSVLTIINYIGTGAPAGTDQLYFGGTVAPVADFDFGFGPGVNVGETTPTGGFYEVYSLVPVPEPATLLVGALVVGALAWNQRRRMRELFVGRRVKAMA